MSRVQTLSDRELEAMIAKAGLPQEADKVLAVIDGIHAYAERWRRQEARTGTRGNVVHIDFGQSLARCPQHGSKTAASRVRERDDEIESLRNIAQQAMERD